MHLFTQYTFKPLLPRPWHAEISMNFIFWYTYFRGSCITRSMLSEKFGLKNIRRNAQKIGNSMIYRAKITNKISMKIANFISGVHVSTTIQDRSVAQLVWTYIVHARSTNCLHGVHKMIPLCLMGTLASPDKCIIFYAQVSSDRGIIILVCVSVCLSEVNFNLHYNFWTVRERSFIFDMHTPLMTPFQMTPMLIMLWPWLWPWSLK